MKKSSRGIDINATKSHLEEALKNFDWKQILGEEKEQERFLKVFVELHSQLRGKDELKIEVRLKEMQSYHIKWKEPIIDIVLYDFRGDRKVVQSWSSSRVKGSLLLYEI